MEVTQKKYSNPINYKKRRVNMLSDVTINSMNAKDEIVPVTLKKGRKYSIDECSRMDANGIAIMLCTIVDMVFGDRYECILECSEVIDLFLCTELSQY
jgi:hypothetical protein